MPQEPGPLGTLCLELVEELGASACAVSRVLGELLVQIADHTTGDKSLINGMGYLVPDYPLTAQVLERREPVAVSLADPDADEDEARLLKQLGFDSLLMLTLDLDGEPWALVEVYGDTGRRFEHADIERARAIVARTATQALG